MYLRWLRRGITLSVLGGAIVYAASRWFSSSRHSLPFAVRKSDVQEELPSAGVDTEADIEPDIELP